MEHFVTLKATSTNEKPVSWEVVGIGKNFKEAILNAERDIASIEISEQTTLKIDGGSVQEGPYLAKSGTGKINLAKIDTR